MADEIRQIGVSEVTYYRWREEFGGLKIEQVKRPKELELRTTGFKSRFLGHTGAHLVGLLVRRAVAATR